MMNTDATAFEILAHFKSLFPRQVAAAIVAAVDSPASLSGWQGLPFAGAEELDRVTVGAAIRIAMPRHFRESVPFIEIAREIGKMIEFSRPNEYYEYNGHPVTTPVDSRHSRIDLIRFTPGGRAAILAGIPAREVATLPEAIESVETIAERAYEGSTARCAARRAFRRAFRLANPE